MKSSEPSSLGAEPEQPRSVAVVIGVWLVSVAATAALTYAAGEWLLFLYIAWTMAVMSAFVPKRPIARAVSAGIAVGVTSGLALLIKQ